MSDYKGEFLDVEKYLEVRNKYRNMFRSGQPLASVRDVLVFRRKIGMMIIM
jgi:hypothetical protein